jgi:hypothetical protein
VLLPAAPYTLSKGAINEEEIATDRKYKLFGYLGFCLAIIGGLMQAYRSWPSGGLPLSGGSWTATTWNSGAVSHHHSAAKSIP